MLWLNFHAREYKFLDDYPFPVTLGMIQQLYRHWRLGVRGLTNLTKPRFDKLQFRRKIRQSLCHP